MLRFNVPDAGRSDSPFALRNAYLIGANANAIRGDIRLEDGTVLCEKREAGAVALALQYEAGDCGELTLQTCLLPEREEPYLLSLELARHQLMVIYSKMEDWAMFELGTGHRAMKRTAVARKLFIEALCQQSGEPASADKNAHDALVAAIDGAEELALAHSELLLNRRKLNGHMPRFPIGCGLSIQHSHDRVRSGLTNHFDFVNLPLSWRLLAPEEGEYRWAIFDQWVEWIGRSRVPAVAGPIISFEPSLVPDWLYIWEHDFDTLRDLIYEHVEKLVSRYSSVISTWNVISGLHVNNHFTFSFDQIMDLSRMTVMLVKKTQPSAKALVEVRQPFGEYYATNPKSIPPVMYGDLLVQGAIPFDGIVLKLLLGQALPSQYTRDLMQISDLLDQFAATNKPLTLSVAVPSEPVTPATDHLPHEQPQPDPNCGHWRKPWSAQVQSHWFEAMVQIALSKPYIDSIAWNEITDHDESELPCGGLIGPDMQPKAALRRLVAMRKALAEQPVYSTSDP